MASRATARDRERRAARDEALRRKAHQSQRKRRIIAIGGVVGVLLLVGATILAAANSTNSTSTATTTTTTAAAAARPPWPRDRPSPHRPGPAGATLTGATPCPAEDGSSPRTTQFAQPPPTCIDPTKSYDAIVTTSVGSFTFFLNSKLAPRSVNNFVVLARYHYYDGTAGLEHHHRHLHAGRCGDQRRGRARAGLHPARRVPGVGQHHGGGHHPGHAGPGPHLLQRRLGRAPSSSSPWARRRPTCPAPPPSSA